MINIFTALYCEARPLIQYLDLKRQKDINRFQVFSNDNITLLITGTGMVNAAIGVTSLCSINPPASGDILVNIGICGTENTSLEQGSLFLCNKIIDICTYRCYYPDMLFMHSFNENSVASSPRPVKDRADSICEKIRGTLIDMESSGIYQTGALFYQPHQMFFFKIVSDHVTDEKISREKVAELIEKNTSKVTNWILKTHDRLTDKPNAFTEQEIYHLKKTIDFFRLSVSMAHQLRQLMYYYKIQHGSFIGELNLFLKENLQEPCKSKNEGKKYFDKLRNRFI